MPAPLSTWGWKTLEGSWPPQTLTPPLPETFHLICTPFYPPRSSSHQPGSTPHPWLQEPPRMLGSTCNPPADQDGSGCWQKWREPLNHCSRGKGVLKCKLRRCISLEHLLTCWISYFGHLARWHKDAPTRHECPHPRTIWGHKLSHPLAVYTYGRKRAGSLVFFLLLLSRFSRVQLCATP